MSIIISSECIRICDNLIGQLDYYEAILEREALTTREGEFRNCKLSLTVDLLEIAGIPEDLKTELISSVIKAWRLEAPEITIEQRDEELRMLLQRIEAVRSAAVWAKEHSSSAIRQQLDVAIMFSLPLMSSDLRPEYIPRVHNLLALVMDYYAAIIE
jgi:hypothetical protein